MLGRLTRADYPRRFSLDREWWYIPAVSAPEVHAPGQAGSGTHPPSATGRAERVRAMLTDLFPAPGEPASRAALARWGFVFTQVVVVGVGAVAMLARLGGRPAWEGVYAEDPGIYLPAALAHPWHLLQSYRRCLSLVLLPLAQLEIADNGVNTICYLLVGLFGAALLRPRTRAGAAVAAVLAFAAAASTSLGLVFAPLFAARAIVVHRRLREHVATAGWALGCLVQLLVIATSHMSRLTPHNPLNAE